eukprot:TRINITY_DN32389_c0_g1_i1.p1 TRINITY_DN32389_c0_g1~~TRINITY_DN32389_c0_g1_i1.p1  ORF type:complete len:129 (-),score=7.52 TRINITY_DN32389_c0_g1_i1:106-492(-)
MIFFTGFETEPRKPSIRSQLSIMASSSHRPSIFTKYRLTPVSLIIQCYFCKYLNLIFSNLCFETKIVKKFELQNEIAALSEEPYQTQGKYTLLAGYCAWYGQQQLWLFLPYLYSLPCHSGKFSKNLYE